MNKNQTKQKIEIDILIQCKDPTNKKRIYHCAYSGSHKIYKKIK